jgi:hypothetical protein
MLSSAAGHSGARRSERWRKDHGIPILPATGKEPKMPLNFTDQESDQTEYKAMLAHDSATQDRVVVHASHEAITDFGLRHVQRAASAKYDAGLREPDGRVVVRTSDC